MSIHIAITRRVRPGREAEFQVALREFFQTSFAHGGVLGATMIVPPPGSDSREFGILRTFADEKERDDSLQGVGRKVPASDGNRFLERPAFAWTRSVVSLAAKSSAALEDGASHFPRGLSDCRDIESDAWCSGSPLAIYS